MSPDNSEKIEGIERLAELHDAGQITDDEYERLKAQVIDPNKDEQHAKAQTPKMPVLYTISLLLGVASILLGGLAAIVAIVVSIVTLVAYRMKQGRWMAWAGLSLGTVYFLTYLAAYGYIG